MERLTYWNEEYGCWSYRGLSGDAATRLAAYEDSGLEPKEIVVMLERYRAFRSAISDETGQPMVSWTRAGEICRAEKDARLIILPDRRKKAVIENENRDCAYSDFTAKDINDLLLAWDSGRLVVLPCKVGSVVYELRYHAENDHKRKGARKYFDRSLSGCTWRIKRCPELCYVKEKKCTKSDFGAMGRTVFLTREEAEMALSGGPNADRDN